METLRAAALLLADGRLPTGSHAHSGGIEPAVAAGRVRTVEDLRSFCLGRLYTAGATAAGLSAAACDPSTDLAWLDAEADARTPSPRLRAVSRKLGRQLVRTGLRLWRSERLEAARPTPGGPHQPISLGCLANAAGLSPQEAAVVAANETVTVPAAAAIRLLGLDPFTVYGMAAELSDHIDTVAQGAFERALKGDLPSNNGPLLDVYAEQHSTLEAHYFAS